MAITPSQASAQNKATVADLLGGFAKFDATQNYLPGSNGYVSQDISDRMFAVLSKILGGSAPKLNFVQTVDPTGTFHGSADVANNRINIDPSFMVSLINPRDSQHGAAVNGIPHEMMHLRQLASVLADIVQREGGAQAFADLVTPGAARQAGIPYAGGASFDGPYAPYVQTVNQQYGRDWILGGQMGKPPAVFP